MFGGDGAVKSLHRVVHDGVDVFFLLTEEHLGVPLGGGLDVVVQVAVAQVPEVDKTHAGNGGGQRRIGLAHKLGNPRHGDRDVVFDVQAFLGLGQGNTFADVPQVVGLGDVFGHHSVTDQALLQRGLQQALELGAGVVFGFAVGVFEQHTPRRVFPQRHTQVRVVFVHQAQRKLAHHLKARQARAQAFLRQHQQGHGVFQRGHGGPGGELRGRLRVQLHGGGGDDAKCPFAANEQIAQVVTGVVLAQAREAVPDFALRGDHFHTQAQFARVAVAHDLRAAGIGGQVAADGAAAFGTQAQREQKASLLRRRLQVLQHTTGFHGDGRIARVHRTHGAHALQAQHNLRAAVVGGGTHHEAGVATLRHDAGTCRSAGLDHVGHLLRAAGAHHGQCRAAHTFAPVLLPRAQVSRGVVMGEDVGVADDAAQGVKQGEGRWAHGVVVAEGWAAAAILALRRRRRTCMAQAVNRATHSSTCSSAR